MVISPSHGRLRAAHCRGVFQCTPMQCELSPFSLSCPAPCSCSLCAFCASRSLSASQLLHGVRLLSSFCATIHNREVPAHSKLMVHYLCLFLPVRPSVDQSIQRFARCPLRLWTSSVCLPPPPECSSPPPCPTH